MLGYCEAAGPALAAKRWSWLMIGWNFFILAPDWLTQKFWVFSVGSHTVAALVPIGHSLNELISIGSQTTTLGQ